MKSLASICFHAERLHEEPVWRQVERTAERANDSSLALTFLVHPFWATLGGADIARPLARLRELGHEIGQHTHYYNEQTGIRAAHKATDMSPENVLRRLNEDYARLT